MAPEQVTGQAEQVGPHTDIYALGAILYECLTGRPPFRAESPLDTLLQVRSDEPVSPSRLQPKMPRSLEAICLQCLQKEPHRRYASAEALADDLRAFQEGRPVRARPAGALWRFGAWSRRNPVPAALAGALALLLVVLAAGSLLAALWLGRQRDEALAQRERAERAEQERTHQLWRSYRDEARARRLSRQPGQRFASLETLAKAAAIRPALELRNEAIACLALVDMALGPECLSLPPGTSALAFDASLEHYARGDAQGAISLRRVADDQELVRLPGPGRPAAALDFSPDGRFLAARYIERRGDRGLLCVWELGRRAEAVRVGGDYLSSAFSPDGRQLAISRRDGVLLLYDLTSGQEVQRLGLRRSSSSIAFHPDGRKLALNGSENIVELRDLKTGKLVQTFKYPKEDVVEMAWSPDGRLLATACADSQLYVWNADDARQPLAILAGHLRDVNHVTFNHRGNLLASASEDGTVRLRDPGSGRLLVSSSGAPERVATRLRFSRDDQRLACCWDGGSGVGLWQVRGGQGYRVLPRPPRSAQLFGLHFSPDGRLLAATHDDGVRLWDLAADQTIAFLPIGKGRRALFHPREGLLTYGTSGLHRWPLRPSSEPGGGLRLGPREDLGVAPAAMPNQSCLSSDGRILALADGGHGEILALDLSQPGRKLLGGKHPRAAGISVSPDGRWVASSTWQGQGVRVWTVGNNEPVREFPCGSATVAFSPDGKWLVTGTGERYSFWEVGSWKLSHEVRRDRGGTLPGPAAFAPDGKVLAITRSRFLVQLVDPATGRPLADLEAPDLRAPGELCFSPDGSQLAVACWLPDSIIQVWDLRSLRRQLADMGLDLDLPPYPPPLPKASR